MGDEGGGAAGEAFRRRLAEVLAIDPAAPAIEFASRWYRWGELRATVDAVAEAFTASALAPGAQVGVLLRNRPVSIGLLLGVLGAGGCVVVLNPQLGRERVNADVAALGLGMVVGARADVEDLLDAELRQRIPTLAVDDLGSSAHHAGPTSAGPTSAGPTSAGPTSAPGEPTLRPDTAIRLLTSGTTGPPKRSDLTFATLDKVLQGAKHYESKRDGAGGLREGIVIVNSPLVHLGGLFRVLQSVVDGRRMALLERFTVDGWLDLVRRHRPKTASLVPTALRMVLDADIDPADLASLRSVVSGTAPLSPETAEAFTAKYGVPVLTNYAATEFGGGVAGWNLADHQRFWTAKRGSVGRAHPGCALRVVDEAGSVLPADTVGLLEVKADQLPGSGWIRTNDLARLDDDGFLWVVGRADQTIMRGGLKVQPDTVRAALERHPGVRAAAVVGVDDERLGQVPVAVVERAESSVVDEMDLLDHAARFLARYEIPVRVVFVDALPRTVSAKVDLRAVQELAGAAAKD
jgi:acyl-CoA synthetase (AMP-forming)/AMP-acid ligase II